MEFPAAGSLVDGTAIVIAEFGALPLVNGGIVDRTLYYNGETYALEDLALIATSVGATGLFAGSVENLDLVAVGSYTGAFAGDGAAFVGGNIVIDDRGLIGAGANAGGLATILGNQLGDVQEYGIFVLAPCVGVACNTLP